MKKYENPMLQVVSICNNDIITMSIHDRQSTSGVTLAPEMRGFDITDDWDAGY